jgi:hypothetical protein
VKPATKRRLEHAATACCTLAAVGLAVGFWAYDRIEFFLPGMTVRYLRGLEREAKRASKERAA